VTGYAETIAWLQSLEVARGWDLKLDRMEAALDVRGRPERRFRSIHVAGTNGKGSTAAMIEAVLRAGGRRTGLYTSPHLVDFAERIRAGGLAIPHDDVVSLVGDLRAVLEGAGIALTHFEFATLLAFEWFARVGVDVAVVEVGLGGRLDATNVVVPLAGAVTSIGRDHEAFLGASLAGIAREKAGIAKPGVPLVVGAVAPEVEAVIREVADGAGAPVVSTIRDAQLDGRAGTLAFRSAGVAWDGLTLALPGRHQVENARTALTVLAHLVGDLGVDANAVRRGLATTWWPGRLADLACRPRTVVDGAHNPDGVAALVRELPGVAADAAATTLVFAVMGDKEWAAMLDRLVPHVGRIVATAVGRRALDPRRVAAAFADRVPVEVVEPAREAVLHARRTADPAGFVLVAGSLFLAGEAYTALRGPGPLVAPWQGWR
jgi:dihydrofolate synthase/folylpolyglutamate synthase